MKKVLTYSGNVFNYVIVFSFATMCILVFLNSLMRYTLDYGISWSDEVSRFLLIYITFFGAIAALKDNQHLGVDMFVKKLPFLWRKIVFVISNALILIALGLVLKGSWINTVLNLENHAPASGLPLFLIYGVGLITAIGMGGILLKNIYTALFVHTSKNDFIMTQESEEIVNQPIERDAKEGER